MNKLIETAKAVLKSANQDYVISPCLVDSSIIEALRQAVAEAKVYTPMTYDEKSKIMKGLSKLKFSNPYSAYFNAGERAVIERQGLTWGGE